MAFTIHGLLFFGVEEIHGTGKDKIRWALKRSQETGLGASVVYNIVTRHGLVARGLLANVVKTAADLQPFGT